MCVSMVCVSVFVIFVCLLCVSVCIFEVCMCPCVCVCMFELCVSKYLCVFLVSMHVSEVYVCISYISSVSNLVGWVVGSESWFPL